ncbi:putative cytochrome P450 [Nocardia brasiliensis NBRC 14402]|uniref:cytochrome P450 n=1 Tax=Nocardia brasiliensis TaxID=37326 RepID=UPI00045D3270|nr:cytochrome P450 [Nocardia brasiliensis]ASF10601.1 cytochrome P450 [Nocardia brasiliensis]GAJ80548.1 putative cytochrome P450 [Nocardia brasiliensis NBRC 14402]SUB10857.1 Cytochrome P450 107B1 [Nocardia brasiliensis]
MELTVLTTSQTTAATTTALPGACPVQHGSPIDTDGPRVLLHTAEFAADPHRAYAEMRERYGSLVPIEVAPGVPATLVVGYQAALRILNDPEHFPADPRTWQQNIPEDSPVKPMMEWYPNALRNSGAAHARYRHAYTAAIDGIDLHALHSTVERIAIPLINTFCQAGSADLVTQYAFPLVFEVLNQMVGCSAELGQRVATGMAALFDTVNAAQGMQMLSEALMELIQLRRAEPGDDVTSRLAHHPAGLDDVEMLSQLISFYGAGIEPQQNLIINTLLLMVTDDRFGGDVLGGSLSTRDALDEVLFNDPPMANFCTSYPRQPILIDNNWLPAHQPVLISLAGCNNDPEIRGGDRTGNRSHLAWSAGPHACPAKSVAYLVVQDAIDQLLDALPEMQLAVPVAELSWRPGPFHRALASLPVIFPKSPPLNMM